MHVKRLFQIALGLSLFAWLIDLREFQGDFLLALFEILMMTLLFFLPLLFVYTIISLLFKKS